MTEADADRAVPGAGGVPAADHAGATPSDAGPSVPAAHLSAQPGDGMATGAAGEAREPGEAGGTASLATAPAEGDDRPDGSGGRRPLIERVGMFLIAVVLAALFGGVALAFLSGGEVFLGAMAAIGCLMTLWVGGLTLIRG